MQKLSLLIALIAFTFVSCDQSQAPTQPQSPSTSLLKASVEKDISFTICGVTLNCPDVSECLCITITQHVVTTDNGIHVSVKYSGYGVDCTTGDPTGTTYSGKENFNGSFKNGSFNATGHISSKDGGDNIKIHFTYNANGDMTSYHLDCE